MKILIIHNRYRSTNIGGEDIVYDNEAKLLKQYFGDDNVFLFEVSNDEIRYFSLLFTIWFSKKYYQIIFDIVKNNNIDIVHIHNYFPVLTSSVFCAAKNAGAKVVHTLHNYRWWCIAGIFYRDGYGICEQCLSNKNILNGIRYKCYRKSITQSILAQLAFWCYRASSVFNKVDVFFALTDFQKNKLVQIGLDKNKIFVKPNMLSLKDTRSNNKTGYIFVGRLEESKGIELLLSAWSKLGKEFILTVIGEGPLKQNLIAQYPNDNIVFLGKKSHAETLDLISKSRFLVQPSLWYETFGLTIIEAMSFGVPVIGFNIGTRPDFIKDKVNGFLCEPNKLMETILMSKTFQDYALLSDNAVKSSKQFSDDLIIIKQIQRYRDLMYY